MPLACLILFLLPPVAAAQSASASLFNEGNALYRRGEFENARNKYLQAVEAGAEDPRLFYNLGNANFKSGRLGEAILWYERAHRLAPRDEDIIANLRFARAIKPDRDPEEENALWQFLASAFFFPTLNEVCIAFGLFLLLVFGLAVWRLLLRAPPMAGWLFLILTAGSMAALSGAFLAARIYHRQVVVEAVVIAKEGTARSGPDQSQTAVFVVHEGTKVRVDRRESGWLLVRLANGWGGWLPAEAVEII